MSRLQESIAYIQGINGLAAMAIKVSSQASRLAKPQLLEKMLKLPIGSGEKTKSLVGLSPKDDGYRKAGRALLLIELLYDYHGNGPVENFLTQRRDAILGYLTEERLQNAIRVKLTGLPHIVVNGLVYRTYDDRNSTMPWIPVNALSILNNQSGPPAMIAPRGAWMHVYMSDTPETVDFASTPHVEGIFSTSASGGCIVVAFLYGGKRGQPLKAASMVHVPGGNPATPNWNAMLYGNRQPSSIIVFLSTLNNIGGSEVELYRKFLTNTMNFPEQLILFHLTSETVNHAVDRWGNFGRAFAPNGRTPGMHTRSGLYVIG